MCAARRQSLSPIEAWTPVSTNVMRQSSMSLASSSHLPAGEHEVVPESLVVREEVLLDDLGAVAETEDELRYAPRTRTTS